MDFSPILNHVAKHITLNRDEQDTFTSLLEHRRIKKNEVLVSPGQVATHTYFVLEGCLRNYHLDRDGTVHVGMFATEDWWISDLPSFLSGAPAFCYVDALEHSSVFQLDAVNIERLYAEVPKFERFFRILHQNAYLAQSRRIFENLSLTADERYLNFRKTYPHLEQRVPLKLIASYLGITPEFLSMIRSKLAKQDRNGAATTPSAKIV